MHFIHSSSGVQLRTWLLSTGALCRTLLVMAAQCPGTLEGMLLHALPPAAAEVLLRKLEAGALNLLVCINLLHLMVCPGASSSLQTTWLSRAAMD